MVKATGNADIRRGVSLYSFQEQYYLGKLSLEGCVASAASMGVKGIEMLVDQMVPGYPSITYNLQPGFIARFRELLGRYGLEAVALDVYGETKLYKNRQRTHDELLSELRALLMTAKALGFRMLRLTFHLPLEVIQALIPYAQESDVRLACEVHAPHLLSGRWVEQILEIANRAGGQWLGLMPDLGIFCKRIPQVALDASLRQGATPAIVNYLAQAYEHREPLDDAVARVESMRGNDADLWLAMRLQIKVWTYHDPAVLLDYMPYISHVHGKFYEISADLAEHDVAYEAIMPALIKGGYRGYIMSEYEGQRLTSDIDTGYDEVEQVRRHQAMLTGFLAS